MSLRGPARDQARLDRPGQARGRHRPRARDGRGAEGRQRPPRHGDEPGPGRVHAVPEGDAPQPRRPRLGRPRPVRAVGRAHQPHAVHPALPRRLRPRARRPQGAAHLGQPRPRATPSTATPPASRPPPARWARASATRSAWRWRPAASAACSTPRPPRARAPSTTTSTRSAATATWRRASAREASSLAGTQQLGNLTLIYDDNDISIEGDTDIAFTEDVAARYAAYGWDVHRIDWTNGGTRYEENVQELWDALEKSRRVTDRPSFIALKTDHRLARPERAGHRQVARLRARRGGGRGHQEDHGLRPRPDLRGRRRRHRAHPQRPRARQAGRGGVAGVLRRVGRAASRSARRCSTGCAPAPCPAGWDEGAALLPRRREGRRDPQGVRRGAHRDRPRAPRAVGRLGRPGRVQQHHAQGPAVLHPRRAVHQGLLRRPVRPGAALRHPRARHGLDA